MGSHLRSPQFHQTIQFFNTALSSGQLAGMMQSFGLPDNNVGTVMLVKMFVKSAVKNVSNIHYVKNTD